ncbi:MAG: zf-HC2 domain-containing protein [Acidobacteriota bacterium]|nr:zf-HC2 domain-containing protein [Acidobacteriota bacterium]
MKCAAYHKLIGDRLEGTIRPADRARLDAHLAVCAECRDLMEDFRKIAESARTLDDEEIPSPHVWPAILTGVRAIRRGAHKSFRSRSRGFGFAVPRWAYAAGFVLVGAAVGLMVGLGPWRGAAQPGMSPDQAATVVKLKEAETHYKLAIQALNEALQSGSITVDPATTALFARDLGAVESAIQACREAVDREPGNVDARVFLLAAYQKKIEILDGVMQFRKQSPSPALPGASL